MIHKNEEEIITDYKNNLTKQEIICKYSTSLQIINKILQLYNIPIRKYTYTSKIRKCNIDLDCFKNINTFNKAYLLGLILSDGSIDKNGQGFQLTSKNIELLQYAKDILKSEHKIVTVNSFDKRTNKTYTRYNIHFCSREMVADLNKLGLTNNKSINCIMPKIENKYIWHLIRGIFDGDGSIYDTSKIGKLRFSIIGSLEVITFIKQLFLDNNLSNTKLTEIKTNNENEFIYKIKMNSYNDLLFLRNKIYENADYYLKRKFIKFSELKEYPKGYTLSNKNKIWKQVKSINLDNNIEIIFDNIKLCAEHHNITDTKFIYRILRKERNRYKNYTFEYI